MFHMHPFARVKYYQHISAQEAQKKPPSVAQHGREQILEHLLDHMNSNSEKLLDKDFRKRFIAALFLDDPKIIFNHELKMLFTELKEGKNPHRSLFHFFKKLTDDCKNLIGILQVTDDEITGVYEYLQTYFEIKKSRIPMKFETFKNEILSIQTKYDKEILKDNDSTINKMREISSKVKIQLEEQLIAKIKTPVYSLKKTAEGLQVTKENPVAFYGSFSGGGAKGAGYSGVIEALEKMDRRKWLKHFCGSSAGSFLATLGAFGIEGSSIKEIYQNLKFDELKSNDAVIKSVNPILIQQVKREYEKISSCKSLTEQERERIELFLKVCDSDEQFMVLFQDLAILKKYDPDVYKDLSITGTRKGDKEIKIFSPRNTPHVSVAKAVAASCSLPIPLLTKFKPEYFEEDVEIQDGGIRNNSPIEYFETQATEENTIAVFFEMQETIDRILDEKLFLILKPGILKKFVDSITGHHTYSNWNTTYRRLRKLGIGKSAINILFSNIGVLSFADAKKYQNDMVDFARNSVLNACQKRVFSSCFKTPSDLLFSFSTDELKLIIGDEIQVQGTDLVPFYKETANQVISFKRDIKNYFHEILENKTNPPILESWAFVKQLLAQYQLDISDSSIVDYLCKLTYGKKDLLDHLKNNLKILPEAETNSIFLNFKEKIHALEFENKKNELIDNYFSPRVYDILSALLKGPATSLKDDVTLEHWNELKNLEFNPQFMENDKNQVDLFWEKYQEKLSDLDEILEDISNIPAM